MTNFKCLFGMHRYEVLKEVELTDVRGNVIGATIISRCNDCGKIKSTDVITTKMV